MPGPKACYETFCPPFAHDRQTVEVGYGASSGALDAVSEARKQDHGRDGYAAPGEIATETFSHTPDKEDPAVAIYRASAEESVCAGTLCELPGVPENDRGPQWTASSNAGSDIVINNFG